MSLENFQVEKHQINTLASAAAKAALASININTDPNQFLTEQLGKDIPNLELFAVQN